MNNLQYSFYSLLFLLLASFFETLLAAYTLSGEAGAARLSEKYPEGKKHFAYWAPRWLRLHAILLTFAVCAKIASVGATVWILHRIFPEHMWGVSFAWIAYVLGFIVLLKVLPKALAESYADRLSASTLWFVGPLANLFLLVSLPVAFLERSLMRNFTARSDEDDRPTTEDEIISLVDQTDEEELEEEEREIIKSVFEFGETVTREIMTPRVDIKGIEDNLNVEEAIQALKNAPHSRFPAYHESIDDIRGIVHVKELLKFACEKDLARPITSLLNKKPTFVPESMPINDLLQLLKKEQTQAAIVVDEYGGTAGIVTIEDVIEELVGEIEDEYDTQESKFQQLADGSVIVDARLPLDEVNDLLDIRIPECEEYDSIGGYVFHELGRIPIAGERLDNKKFQITIQSASPRKLDKLRVVRKE